MLELGRAFVRVFAVVGLSVAVAAQGGGRITICHVPPGNPENRRTITISQSALAAHLAHGDSVGSCEGLRLAKIVQDRASGTPGTTFRFTASVEGLDLATVLLLWDFGGGASTSGPSVETTFPAPGVYPIKLEVQTLAGEVIARGESNVSVIDPAQPVDLFGNPLPALAGDFDGDGAIELDDLLRLRQNLGGARLSVTTEEALRGDYDLDGHLTEGDAELLAAQLLEQTPRARRLVPDHGQPGRVVTLHSPALLDPEARIEIQVGASSPILPPRLTLGSISFFIPLDPLRAGEFAEEEAVVAVNLLVNGVVAETHEFRLELPDPVDPVRPLAPLERLLERLPALRADALAHLDGLVGSDLAAELALTDADLEISRAVLTASWDQLQVLETELLPFAQSLPLPVQQVMMRIGNANGLARAVANSELQTALARGPISPATIQILCALATINSTLTDSAEAIGYLCTGLVAAFFGAVAFPLDGIVIDVGALFAAAVACAKYSALLEIPQVIGEILPQTGETLFLEKSGDSLPGATVSITPYLELRGITNLCSLSGTLGSGRLIEYLGRKITLRILQKGPVFLLYTAAKSISQSTTTQLVDLVESVVAATLGGIGLGDALDGLATNLCDRMNLIGSRAQVDAAFVSVSADPAVGTLTPGSGLTPISYTCPTDTAQIPEDGVVITGVFSICTGDAEGDVTIACAPKRDVTITMGDNGSALDDIFEVVVDGQSVLTSSVPVRSISTTLELTVGDHTLQMRGLAAPDGIGTYFITVSGGQLIGPPTSGSNLTAGTVFTWTLVVSQS